MIHFCFWKYSEGNFVYIKFYILSFEVFTKSALKMILRRSQSVHFFIYISSSALPLTTLPTSVYSLQILFLLSLINPVNSENVSIIIIHNCGLNKCILEYSSFLPPSNMIFSRNIIFIPLIITFASGGKTISGVRFQNIQYYRRRLCIREGYSKIREV